MEKKEQLEKLEKDILQAQEKLSDTMLAINREQLQLSNIKEKSVKYNSEKQQLLQDISILENTKWLLIESNTSLTKKHNEDVIMLSSKKDALLQEIKNEEEALNIIKSNIKSEITRHSVEINKLLQEKDSIIDAIESIKKQEIELIKSIESKQKEISDLNDNINSLRAVEARSRWGIDIVKSHIKELESQKSILESELKSLKNDVKEFSDILIDKKESIEKSECILKKLITDKKQIESDISNIDEIRKSMNQEKFSIAEANNNLRSRESYIKMKYEEAWIPY